MHSKMKLKAHYPDLDEDVLKKLYGQAKSKRTKEFWNKLVISNVRNCLVSHLFKFQNEFQLVNPMRRNAGWGNVEDINLTDFFDRTRPTYYVAHCLFEHIDCRGLWVRVSASGNLSVFQASNNDWNGRLHRVRPRACGSKVHRES